MSTSSSSWKVARESHTWTSNASANPRRRRLTMHPQSRRRTTFMALGAMALLWLGSGARPAAARDPEFGLLVHQIESQYHARRQHRILIGLAGGLGNIIIT